MSIAIKAENISKAYQLGQIGTGTVSRDIERWVAKIRGKEDPFLKIGEANDRTQKATSDIVWSLKDINFEIQQGDAVGIIGRNGAGKSTLLKLLSRVTSPTTGNIKVKGRIASLLEVGTGFHPELTGKENIYLNGAILGMRKQEIKRKFDEIVDFSGVERYIDTPVKRYSSGMYVRLAFAVAAHLESEILIVDEVLAVGDAEFQKKCIGKMGDVSKGEGRTVLFVSHNMAAVRALCNIGIILKNGLIQFTGSVGDCVDQYGITSDIQYLNEKFIMFNDSFRIYSDHHNRIVDFISLEIKNNNTIESNTFATTQIISFDIVLFGKKTISNLRVAGGVYNLEDIPIGVFFGEKKLAVIENKKTTINISINNHQLAKGIYYMDFSIGTGDHTEGITDFDHVHKALFFEIAYTNESTKQMIPLWPTNWGNINFQNIQIIQK